MKKFLLLLTVAIATLSLSAAPVDLAKAQRTAQSYLNQMYAGKMMAPSALKPVLLKTEIGDTKLNKPVYYIFNTSSTFLVVAGDDRAEEILMIGDEPLKDINHLAPSMQAVLDQYKGEIEYLHNHPNIQVEKPSQSLTPKLRAVTYGPLLTAKWDQEAPYWSQCIFTYNNKAYQCLTGCPATSASMVLYYWKYPTTQVPAVASYTAALELSYYQSVNFTYPSVAATTFDWANMKDTYTSYNSTQSNAVATLMRYVGQLEKMMYGTEAAGGSGIYTTNSQIIATMFKTLGYDSNTRLANKSSYSEANWGALIQNEMAAGRPVVYLGVDTQGGGHAFNVDGYRDSDGKYHVNFGWSGDGNSWYAMNSFTYGGYTFSSQQQAIVGIQPPGGASTVPELSVSPTSLSFTGNTGETYTQTFTVTGSNLLGDVTISKSGSAVYSVSPTTLTAAQAKAGAQVTVTYAPTAAGTQTGTITVSSSNAQSQTVSLTGTSTTVPKLTVNPASLNFSTTVGTPVTQTFDVTGSNLTSGSVVTLTCSGTGYTIDKTNITRNAVNGKTVTVTVTFNPTASGTYNGNVVLKCNGAQDVTVALSGTAVGVPTLAANPRSLSFNANVGDEVTKTFTVTGTDLTGNVSLAVTGNGFSINKTNITRAAAAEGAEVTVTYRPTTGGSSTDTVTLTSNGAQPVTVTLSGIATTTPTITANPTTLDFVTTVGTPVTKSFVVNSAFLEGNVSLAVEGESFTIDKTEIVSGEADNATVNVTYTPTAFGIHTGTVTLTSPNAQPVTVTLNGQADLVKYAPVMLPANESYINLTRFCAEWTDETPDNNVTSYTLEVSAKPAEPVTPDPVSVCDLTGIEAVTNDNNQLPNCASTASQYLPEGWTAENYLYINDGFVITGATTGSGWWSTTTYGSIISPTLDLTGYDKVTVVVNVKSYYPSNYGVGQVRIATNSAYQDYTLGSTDEDEFQTITVVLNCSSSDQVRVQGRANYIAIQSITVYPGDITETAKLKATETGDANYRLIEGITNKSYIVNDLMAEGTFLYKVKAYYADGTESDWSNVEEVTLFENGHGYERGDANHDGAINISDVTAVINAVVAGGEVCPICGDVNGDGEINVSDVTAMINLVSTSANASKPNVVSTNRLLVIE